MKKRIITFIICLLGYGTSFTFAQDVLGTLQKMNNLTYDYISSFLAYPSNHSNTLKVYEKLQVMEKFYREEYDNAAYMATMYDNNKAREYYEEIKKYKELVEAFDEIVGCMAG